MKGYISVALIAIISLSVLLFKKQPAYQQVQMVIHLKTSIPYGIDVSENQGIIKWYSVDTQTKHPVSFVIIRATMGENRVDRQFSNNWDSATRLGFLVGAYHYYDPNENSLKQAANYLRLIHLQKGQFVPIVDIEKIGKVQPKNRLLLGLHRWLDTVEMVYGVKPMIYTGKSFFGDHLLAEFNEYPLWIAAYSSKRLNDSVVVRAHIHQFTKTDSVPGVTGHVDGDILRKEKIKEVLIQ